MGKTKANTKAKDGEMEKNTKYYRNVRDLTSKDDVCQLFGSNLERIGFNIFWNNWGICIQSEFLKLLRDYFNSVRRDNGTVGLGKCHPMATYAEMGRYRLNMSGWGGARLKLQTTVRAPQTSHPRHVLFMQITRQSQTLH